MSPFFIPFTDQRFGWVPLQCQQTLYVQAIQTPGRFHRHPHQSQRHKDPSRAWWEGPKDDMVHPGVYQICLLKSLSAKVNSLPWFTSPPLSHPLSNFWPRRLKEWHYVTMFGCFMACLVRKVSKSTVYPGLVLDLWYSMVTKAFKQVPDLPYLFRVCSSALMNLEVCSFRQGSSTELSDSVWWHWAFCNT